MYILVQIYILTCFLTMTALANEEDSSSRRTIVLFGSSGAVGGEVLRSLLQMNGDEKPSFWDEVILIGRRFPSLGDNLPKTSPKVTHVQLDSLADIDQEAMKNDVLKGARVDACIIAVGMGSPQEADLPFWHSVEVDMVGAMTRMCKNMGARYFSLLSSIDAEENPTAFEEEEIAVKDGSQKLGWWKMVMLYTRMKGLSELATIDNFKVSGPAQVSIMQPCNIVTESTRYGWVDWIIFKIHPPLDPFIPTKYHTVHVKFLGMTMAKDAEDAIRQFDEGAAEGATGDVNVVRLTYGDFIRISGEQYKKIQHTVTGTKWEL